MTDGAARISEVKSSRGWVTDGLVALSALICLVTIAEWIRTQRQFDYFQLINVNEFHIRTTHGNLNIGSLTRVPLAPVPNLPRAAWQGVHLLVTFDPPPPTQGKWQFYHVACPRFGYPAFP